MLSQHRCSQGEFLTIIHAKTRETLTIQVRWIEGQTKAVTLVGFDDANKFRLLSEDEEAPDEQPKKPPRCNSGNAIPVGDLALATAKREQSFEDREAFAALLDRISNPVAQQYFRLLYLENMGQADAQRKLGLTRADGARLHRHAAKEMAMPSIPLEESLS